MLGVGACSSEPSAESRPSSSIATEGADPGSEATHDLPAPVLGQTVYVPVYSHIYFHDEKRAINLTATLSVRNTDRQRPIAVTSVQYYGSNGDLVRRYLERDLVLAPMASREFVVEEDDTSGGAGASFLVEWHADSEVSEPVIESVMISATSAQGISFVSPGRVVQRYLAADQATE
ncbi:MAG: DUF3124 domain-containing protein [Candidatus Eisenbacteria bacterium]|uniref:DUF3124 domain-containing protein n=1 Tax=Eiseniibacteriota bacterium TaxID=2212470 RepID=A0A956LVB4_UNCEI|nr:DUF3124 domain-containing protein [Candidatus Eisenbacteria bacterium]